MTEMRIPQSLFALIATDTKIKNFQNLNDSLTGVVVLPEGPLILASRPILTSLGQGPSQGTLIFARYFDPQYVGLLSTTMRLPLNLTLFTNWQGTNNVGSFSSPIPSIYIHPLNANKIAGYDVINNIDGQPALVLGTALPRDTYDQGLATLSYVDVSVGITAVAFSIAVLLMLEWVVLSRLHRLDVDVTAISDHSDTSANLRISGDDEIASLSKSINKMLEEIEKKSVELRKSERFSAIGELATMVAHDLRNPLQGIANAAFYIKRSPTAGAKEKEMASLIQDDVRYSDKIVNDLLDYSRNMRLEIMETNPQLLMKEALSMVTIPDGVHVQDETEDKPALVVDVDRMKRVFINIMNNAVEAMPKGGSLFIETRERNHMADFIFADTGEGMTKEVLGKIFTPLFTTKAKGMGFGLSICKRIVEAHGGQISVESTPGKGTTFTVSLPLEVAPKGVEKR